jgi:hypothetical protein
MFIFRQRISFFTLIVFLAGCTVTTSTSVSDSITPPYSPLASAVNDLEHTSTYTAHPSSTLTPSATPDQIQIAEDQTVTQAAAMLQTKIAGFPRFCTQDYYYAAAVRFSPNGQWLEEMCYSEDDQDLVLTLASRETQALWKLHYHDYIPPLDFSPDGGMAVVHWSQDGKYAYFYSFLGGDGGECFVSGWDSGSGLFRIDLQTGSVTTLLPPSDTVWWYGFSFSPTDRRLVYATRGRDLKILDMVTGHLINVVPKDDFNEAGGYVWSPDGLRFVYSAVLSANQGERFAYSVRLVDAQSGSEQILLESPDACFAATSWTEDNILILQKNYGQTLVEFDLNSNEIIRESPTTP